MPQHFCVRYLGLVLLADQDKASTVLVLGDWAID